MATRTGLRRAASTNRRNCVLTLLLATTVLCSTWTDGLVATQQAAAADHAIGDPLYFVQPRNRYADQVAQASDASPLERERSFAITPQPLAPALRAFGTQSDIRVAVDGSLAADLQTRGVTGRMPASTALQQLLEGTGLRFRIVSSNTVALERVTAEPENGPSQLGPITVEGQLEADPANVPFITPGSSAYISREQIQRVPPTSPGDIFRSVPGVFSGASNDGNSLNVNIRGAQGLNRVRTMVEGTQQETTGNRGYAGSDQRTYVDPEFIGGVDISKGPGSGPLGSGSTSGVVNVRLLEADDLVLDGNSFGLRIRGGVGSSRINATCDEDSSSAECGIQPRDADLDLRSNSGNFITNDNWFGSVAAAHRSDRLELVLAYARRKEGNYFAGENGNETFEVRNNRGDLVERRFSVFEPGQEVTNTSEETESALVKGALHFGGGHAIQAGFNYYESQFGMAFPTSLTTFAPNQTRLNDVRSRRGWLRYKWDADNDLINFQANVWGTDIDEQGELRQAPQDNESWGAEIWNTSILDTGFGMLTTTYGAEYSRSNGIIDLDVPALSVQGPGELAPTPVGNETFLAFDGTREVFGGHFNAAFSPIHWLTLNAGVRYDRFDGTSTTLNQETQRDVDPSFFAEQARIQTELFAVAIPACIATGPDPTSPACLRALQLQDELTNLSQDDFTTTTRRAREIQNESEADRFSPNFGVTLEPFDGAQLFARYAEGFRALSLVELGQSFAFGTTFDPDLEPEVLKTWEYGFNYFNSDLLFPNDVFRLKLVYFQNEYENFIGRPFEGAPFRNYDKVSLSGIETTLSYDMGRFFADLGLSYYTDLPNNIRTIASLEQPKYSGSLTAGTRWLDESLELGGRATFFDERRPQSGDELSGVDSNVFWEANTIFDLFGSYRVNDNIAFDFSVENVMDKYYLPPLFVNKMPAPGRTARISTTIQF